jgi:hypothetical protein
MVKRLLTAVFGLALLAGPAFATQCPANIRQIDQALASNTQISAADKAKAKALRDQGEKLHKEGKHADSMQQLAEAKRILKIQ